MVTVKDFILKPLYSEIPNRDKVYFCVVKYFNQYAEGITGTNKSLTVYSNDGVGFATKKAAKEFFDKMKEKQFDKFKNKKGKPTPYGNVGCVDYQINFFKIKELEEYLEKYSYYYPTIK
jgi:hypothetical protein